MKKSKKSNKEFSNYVRPTWDEYFVDIMVAASKRATCDRAELHVFLLRINKY